MRRLLLSLPILFLVASCASNRYYSQRVLFRLTDEKGNRIDTAKLRVAVNRTDRNYRIQPNDFLDIRVYTNKGERIIDPNGELQLGSAPGQVPSLAPRTAASQGRSISRTGANGSGAGLELLVQANGMVAVPIIGLTRLSGLTLHQADSTLQVLFTPYYRDTFVQTRVTNNRVIILGSPGGVVVPLANDNMNLLEVLALAGGIDGNGGGGSGGVYRYGGKTSNIRIIRGDLKNPKIEQIDLSTIAGMRRANLQMEPNDIIYIEPVRRPLLDGLADAVPVFTATATLLSTVSIIFTIITISRQN
ncbi:polysaccharide biosynthesis/export family protein [Hymenobacter sp. BT559]|nr:polysaccharide biosynthesis/export family protein [Hymenobacter sp. BT559]